MTCGHWARGIITWAALMVATSAWTSTSYAHPETTDVKSASAKDTSDAKPASEALHKDSEKPKIVTHEFTGTFNGERLTYIATAGETFLKNDDGENIASIFSVTYTKKSAGEPEHRPVTFVFNGGPGSASLWLHLGVFGPKAIALPPDGANSGAAPYKVEDNPLSILDVTDLVFIDPVGTGYSHAMGNSKDEDFLGIKRRRQIDFKFHSPMLTENGRWNSPKYLAGESYGTTRAAQLAAELQNGTDSIYLNGIVLISSVLDFHTMSFQPGNDLPFIAYLPTYAAAAWFHGKVSPKPDDLDGFLREVRAFAQNEYAVALLKGSRLPDAERDSIVKRLAHYTGLSEDYIAQTNLRISAFRFMKQLLRNEERVIGRYDARIIGQDYDSAGESPDADPAFYTIDGAFVAAINDYLTRVLKVNMDRHYKILEGEPSHHWKWLEKPGPGAYVNVAADLGQAMRQNPDLRVFAANGLFDLATPFFATELTMAHNGIPAERVTLRYFDAGHMMYTHRPSRVALAGEVRAFIKAGATKSGG